MRRRTLLAGLSVAVAGCSATSEDASPEDSPGKRGESEGTGGESEAEFDAEAVEAAIVDQINAVRFDQNLPNLGRDSGLRLAAREHCKDMIERDFFAHKNPDGEEPWHRVPCDAGETLYKSPIGAGIDGPQGETFDTTKVGEAAGIVVTGWVESDGHYVILIDEMYERVGVGVVEGGDEFLVTAMFC